MVGDNNSRCFNFQRQHGAGREGEAVFNARYSSELKWKSSQICRDPDFMLIDSEETIELKTDYYEFSSHFDREEKKTPNLFIERFSDSNKKTPGGPWRAKQEGCRYYAYFFTKNGLVFLFINDMLFDFAERLLLKRTLRDVPNEGYVTQGYPVHNSLLLPLSHVFHLTEPLALAEQVGMLLEKTSLLDLEAYFDSIALSGRLQE